MNNELASPQPLIATRSRENMRAVTFGSAKFVSKLEVLKSSLIDVTEIWKDREALETHLKTKHLLEWPANWDHFVIHHRDLNVIEAGEVERL